MRTPSRRMPSRSECAAPEVGTAVGWLILLVPVVGALTCGFPWGYLVAGFLLVAYVALWQANVAEGRRLLVLAAGRPGESICTFTRSLNWRSIDTWVIRAVYEELQAAYETLPIRAGDRFVEELRIDEEDLDDLVVAMAHRAGRSFEETAANPWSGKVLTVRDLVLFLNGQPRLEAA